MPVHDWTRVEAGIFHHFHNAWLTEISNTCNGGLLPSGYYALTEQHAGAYITDVLTLQAPALEPVSPQPNTGGLLVATAEPRVRSKLIATTPRRRTLAIRHVSGHRLIAILEVVSPSNKDRRDHVRELVDKVLDALRCGVHVLLLDLFPPGRHDPRGLPCQVWRRLDGKRYRLPPDEPLTLASYVAGRRSELYLEYSAVGRSLPEMPLFLDPERYVNIPLEPTYQAGYRGVPGYWREVLEAP